MAPIRNPTILDSLYPITITVPRPQNARRHLHIDIETFSSENLPKCGVYRYSQSPDFQILLLTYGFDDEELVTIDLASGEKLPAEFISALDDPGILKYAHNATFEMVCLSRYLGHWLDPYQWRCSMIMASYNTLPLKLADVAVALNVTERKMEEGKDLIRYFSVPCKPTKTNGGRTRNLPGDAPDKWELYKKYNKQDVETERAVVRELEKYPVPDSEWKLFALDQIINRRGVRIDKPLVKAALAVDKEFTDKAYQRAQEITGLSNPSSVIQLKAWLADQNMPMETLAKKFVQEKVKDAKGDVAELLRLRLELSKASVKKYEAMARTVCKDGRVHGVTQFYGASRTGRWAGRLVQLQNVPQNHLPDLDAAKAIVKTGDVDLIEMLYGSVPNTLSELIRTAFIPKDGCRFLVADFSAIEARVLAWHAGEEWVLEEFRGKGKIYEATAARMYHVPADSIVKGNPNYIYRQKGKQATLACGYGGSVGAMKNMGATMPDEELLEIVTAWRAANPHIVAFWSAMDRTARKVVDQKTTLQCGKVTLFWKEGCMFMKLPSGRMLCYRGISYTTNRFGNPSLCYYMPNNTGKMDPVETYGATLVENCTQSIARDLLANAMLNLEAAGYPIVFHVHDEVILEVPIGQGSLDEVCNIMAMPPAWAPDLPLKAAGDELMAYRKT